MTPLRSCARQGLAWVLVLAALLAAGCNDAPPYAYWFPLAPGRVWQYQVERTTMDGTRALRHVVHSVAVPPGSALTGLRRTLDGREIGYTRADAGLFRIDPRGARALVLPDDVTPGTSWQAPTTTSVLENTGPPWETLFRITVPVTLQYSVVATDASVATPAGRFDGCLLIEGRGNTSAEVGNYIGRAAINVTSREWFAPDVGLVRLEREERTDAKALSAGRLVLELDDWRVD